MYMQSSTTRCTQHHKINEPRATRIILRHIVGSNFKLVCRSHTLPHHPHTFAGFLMFRLFRLHHPQCIPPSPTRVDWQQRLLEESDPLFMPLAVNPPSLLPSPPSPSRLPSPPFPLPHSPYPPLRPPLSAPLVKEMTDRIEVRSQVASVRARSRTAAGPHREREEPDATYSGPIVQLHRISSRRRTDMGLNNAPYLPSVAGERNTVGDPELGGAVQGQAGTSG